jgi:hypothetical protein
VLRTTSSLAFAEIAAVVVVDSALLLSQQALFANRFSALEKVSHLKNENKHNKNETVRNNTRIGFEYILFQMVNACIFLNALHSQKQNDINLVKHLCSSSKIRRVRVFLA